MLQPHFLRALCLMFVGLAPLDHWSQFGPVNIISDDNNPYKIIVEDFDNDGDNDMLVHFFWPKEIVWYENLGMGDFSPKKVIAIPELQGASINEVCTVDFNNDGAVDVIVSFRYNGAPDKVVMYENTGDGVFSSEFTLFTHDDGSVSSLDASDTDGDGDTDFVLVFRNENQLGIYENGGDGTFFPHITYSLNSYPVSVSIVDLDNDGDDDVISNKDGFGEIQWNKNLGDNNLTQVDLIFEADEDVLGICAEDLDGDGDNDLIAILESEEQIVWLENLGGTLFSPALLISNSVKPNAVYTADMDGDGDPDILTSDDDNDTLSWYRNLGEGMFSSEIVVWDDLENPKKIIAADINGDGETDVACVSISDDRVSWFENTGNEDYFSEHIVSATIRAPFNMYAADLDGDEKNDLLAVSYSDDKVHWCKNFGDGVFSPRIEIFSDINGPISVHAADLDGDGDKDVLAASKHDDSVEWVENLGNGLFSAPNLITEMADGAVEVLTSDLDGDGDEDVISASKFDNKIAWYQNQGGASFGGQNIISNTVDSLQSVITADLDGDGDLDIVTGSEMVAWYENDGNGDFSSANEIGPFFSVAMCVFAVDFDLDGDLDVLISDESNDIRWYENDGSGVFSEVHFVDTLYFVASVFADDIDNDGDVDVIASTESRTYFVENLGDEEFSSSEIYLHSGGDNVSKNLHMSDLDGDGDLDMISSFSDNWLQQPQYDSRIVWNENQFGDGCMDVDACNYDPEAYINDGSCCFGVCGCIDPMATNFDPLANCDDQSCKYRISGTVFYDEDENGSMDDSEYGLANQQVQLEPMGWIGYTDDAGQFSFSDLELAEYWVELIPNENFPFLTTTNPAHIVLPDNSDVLIGVSNELPDFGICVDFYPSVSGYPCNDFVLHNICYRNEGNIPIDGIVEVEYDLLFQDYVEVTPIDSAVGNKVFMSFENLLPGQMFFYDITFLSPTVDYIGEFLASTARVYGIVDGDQVAYGEKELTVEMTCSYDPNDKQVFPNGHLDEHLILNETELEYLVRFQNTGNASATNVLVTDTIDENLDLSTFMFMANSHSVQTTVKPDERVVEFFFENIMLPDSTANEPESHGMISFKISPYPNLEPGTVLNNTGNIFFDNNPPIITNTTWNTIHECGGEADHSLSSLLNCEGDVLGITSNYDWIESLSLLLDNVEVSSGESIQYPINEIGTYEFELLARNPLCQESVTIMHEVTVVPIPNSCTGDFNCDGFRNTTDLLAFFGQYGCISQCTMDLDNDGVVSFADLSVFLGLFGEDCSE